MKVLCGRVTSSTTGDAVDSSPWLHIGGVYVVLAIEVAAGGRTHLRLVGDDGAVPGLFDAAMFTTVSSSIPSTWVGVVGAAGTIDLAPRRWLEPGFWEAYFDRDPVALEIYREELRRILAETG